MQQQPTISIPTGSSPASYTTIYDKFRGVDMSTDPALIDTTRSPDAPNLISDTGGYPEKRHGCKTVVEPVDRLGHGGGNADRADRRLCRRPQHIVYLRREALDSHRQRISCL